MNPTPIILRFIENPEAKKHVEKLIKIALDASYEQGKRSERIEIAKEYSKLKQP